MSAILALDLGAKMGFAILRADGSIHSGTKDFQQKKHEGPGQRYLRFRAWLSEVKDANPQLRRIVYENVMGHMQDGAIAAHVYGGFLAVLQIFSDIALVPCDGIAVSTIKKRFAGHGRAEKIDIMNQCRALGFNPRDHNEADALALLHVATGTEPLLTMSGATPQKRPRRAAPMPDDRDPF